MGAGQRAPVSLVVAEGGDGLVGVAGLEVYGNNGLLRSLAVSPEARGRGLGRRLVDRAVAKARGLGVESLYLLTTDAGSWFEKLGFRYLDRSGVPSSIRATPQFAGLCPETALSMRIRLAGHSHSRKAQEPREREDMEPWV